MAGIIDHKQVAGDLLTDTYDKPLIRGLLEALVGINQSADDVAVSLPENLLGIDSAIGVQLELLAALVGARIVPGEEDATRSLIRTQIRANRSNGTIEDLIEVLILLPALDFSVVELPPAALSITIFELPDEIAVIAAQVIMQARAAGVGAGITASSTGGAKTFHYSSQATVTEIDTNGGYDVGVYAGFYPA